MTDLDQLDRLLKQAKSVAAGPFQVRLTDVPADLLAAYQEATASAAQPLIGGVPCVFRTDWYMFLLSEIRKLYAKMEPRSRELGRDGPKEADLIGAASLQDWMIISEVNGRPRLVGRPTGHPTCRGPVIVTSDLCGIDVDGRWARTISRWYRLYNQSDPEKDPLFTLQPGKKQLSVKAALKLISSGI